MKKSILIVYPHNFFEDKCGINSRYIELLKYFKNRDIEVDILALKNFKTSWDNYPTDKGGLVNELFFYDFQRGARFQKLKNRKSNPLAWLKKRILFFHAYTDLPDFAYNSMKKKFNEILQKKQYDFLLISYVYWANLVSSRFLKNTLTTLDLSDFITINQFDSSGGDVKIGPMIQEEIRRVNLFDKVMCISDQEKFFFSQLAPHPQYYYIPAFMEKNDSYKNGYQKYDILFVGSDNPHNRKGIKWFFDEIRPRLFDSIKLLIVGSISKYAPVYDNVTCLPSVENIADAYNRSKISICPILGGTGMKIKIVEALSFGLPVVTTTKGIAGFPAKNKSGCLIADSPGKFARSIHMLLSDKDYYNQQRRFAEEFFKENFEKSIVYRQLDEIFMTDLSTMDTTPLSVKD
jgi:glycosyltransferase involved in cell wall biosynthesis